MVNFVLERTPDRDDVVLSLHYRCHAGQCGISISKVKWGIYNLEQSGQKQSQPQATSIISGQYYLHGGGVWQ